MLRAWAWLLTKLQDRCDHPPQSVTADVLEGDAQDLMVKWCRLCGAYARVAVIGPAASRVNAWTRPRPLWWVS